MDWLKKLIGNLPLDKISEYVDSLVKWWGEVVKDIPVTDLPLFTYVGGSAIVLFLWYLVARIIPRPLGGISWIVLCAILLTPGTSLGESTNIAPACVGVVYSVLISDYASALHNLLPIMAVIVAGLFLGFLWQLVRGAVEHALYKRAQNIKARKEQEEREKQEEQQAEAEQEQEDQQEQSQMSVSASDDKKPQQLTAEANKSKTQADDIANIPPTNQHNNRQDATSYAKNNSHQQWWSSFRNQLQRCRYTYVQEDADTEADYISFPQQSSASSR